MDGGEEYVISFHFKVVFAVLIIVNIAGNALVCLVVLRNVQMRTQINLLLVNLAISDTTFAIFFTPRKLFYELISRGNQEGIARDYMCKFLTYGNLSWMAFASSAFTLVVIGTERYYAVLYPFSARGRFTKERIVCAVTLCWVLGAVLILPETIALKFNTKYLTCVYVWTSKDMNRASTIIWPLAAGVIPFTILAFLYGKVIRTLWFSRQNQCWDFTGRTLFLRRKKITTKVITVTIVFGLFVLPTFLYVFVDNIMKEGSSVVVLKPKEQALYQLKHVMYLLNATINPFLYTLQDKQFRKFMAKQLCCRKTVEYRGILLPQRNTSPSRRIFPAPR